MADFWEESSLAYASVIGKHADSIATMSRRNAEERGYAGWRTLLGVACIMASTLCIIAERLIVIEIRMRDAEAKRG